jgi:hypothetical protein
MSRRDDDLEILDADISKIMGQLEIPDLPAVVQAALKLELSVLIQMRLDLNERGPKPLSHPN